MTIPAPFGTLLGVTHGGVQVYSSNYKQTPPEYSGPDFSYSNFLNGVYTGSKWQCVEFSRRYLIVNHGITFASIRMAYNIFDLKHVSRLADDSNFPFISHRNFSKVMPEVGSLVIWEPQGYFHTTGHVAVVTAIGNDHIDIVEQNVDDAVWPKGRDYSRRLRVTRGEHGNIELHCTFRDTKLLGWMSVGSARVPEE
ncbi:hypothetical protein HK096_003312 [Nowakowskiella sp. JEL0078]|nr:hypothetical protein HK096_003312 [Nowakowskiella sp. JEL0078]